MGALTRSLQDNLISEFQTKLKEKDEEYVKALRRQTEDVDSLVERMGTSYAELRAAYEQELQQIEDAFLQVRGNAVVAWWRALDAGKRWLTRGVDVSLAAGARLPDAGQPRGDEQDVRGATAGGDGLLRGSP